MSFIVFIRGTYTHKFQGSAYSFEEKSFFLVFKKKNLNLLINLKKDTSIKLHRLTLRINVYRCTDFISEYITIQNSPILDWVWSISASNSIKSLNFHSGLHINNK